MGVGKIVYGPGASRWLSASLSSKVAPATLTVSLASSNLAKGTYTATVPVISGAAINSPQSVTVTLTVVDTPAITLAPGTLTFGATQGGIDPAAKTVAVTNDGAGTLTGLEVGAITYGPGATGWLTAATLSATSAPATLTLQPTVGTLSAGTYTADVPVRSAVASNSPQTVAVTLTVEATAPFTGQWSGTYDFGLISAVLQQNGSSVTGTINNFGGCIFGVTGVANGNSLSITNWVLQSGNGVDCFIESAAISGSLDASGNTWSGTGATTYPGAGGPVTWTFSMSRVSGGS